MPITAHAFLGLFLWIFAAWVCYKVIIDDSLDYTAGPNSDGWFLASGFMYPIVLGVGSGSVSYLSLHIAVFFIKYLRRFRGTS